MEMEWIGLKRGCVIVRLRKVFCAQLQTGVETSECIIKNRIRQPVPTVDRNVKFPSKQTEADQCTAENATANEDHHEDIKLTS